jgi:hypothetical protein
MSEVEVNMFCENCGSSCRLLYDSEEVNYEPENCPFCGEVVGTLAAESYEDEDEELDEDDDDENHSWN